MAILSTLLPENYKFHVKAYVDESILNKNVTQLNEKQITLKLFILNWFLVPTKGAFGFSYPIRFIH